MAAHPAPRPRTARATLLAVAVAAGLSLTACGGDDTSGTSTEVEVIRVTVADGTVTPADERIEVSPGQPIDIEVTADVEGELHVHSSPEQEFTYGGDGATTTIKLQIDRPGVVEIETHDPQQVVATLTVQ